MSNEMRRPESPSRIILESPSPRADDRDVHLSGDDLLLASWQSYRPDAGRARHSSGQPDLR